MIEKHNQTQRNQFFSQQTSHRCPICRNEFLDLMTRPSQQNYGGIEVSTASSGSINNILRQIRRRSRTRQGVHRGVTLSTGPTLIVEIQSISSTEPSRTGNAGTDNNPFGSAARDNNNSATNPASEIQFYAAVLNTIPQSSPAAMINPPRLNSPIRRATFFRASNLREMQGDIRQASTDHMRVGSNVRINTESVPNSDNIAGSNSVTNIRSESSENIDLIASSSERNIIDDQTNVSETEYGNMLMDTEDEMCPVVSRTENIQHNDASNRMDSTMESFDPALMASRKRKRSDRNKNKNANDDDTVEAKDSSAKDPNLKLQKRRRIRKK